MKLSEIFQQLSVGEFSKLKFGEGLAMGEIDESVWPKLVPHVNLALTALHTRFFLREGHLRILLVPDRTVYNLDDDFALSNVRSKETERYIIDTDGERFIGDVQKVEMVRTDSDWILPLNDNSKRFNVSTPRVNQIRVPLDIVNGIMSVPEQIRTKNLYVTYRANYPMIKIPIGYFNPEKVEVDLPDNYLNALLNFVASRVFNPIGMQQDFHAGNSYFAKYEQECQRLENAGVSVDRDNDTANFEANGWA